VLLTACSQHDRSATVGDTEHSSVRSDSLATLMPQGAKRASVLVDSTEVSDASSWKTYRDERYRFEFKYPPELHPTTHFSTKDILPGNWRAMADSKDKGTPIIAVPIVHIGQRTAYPRFYDVEFRIGVSESGVSCGAGNGERAMGPVTINGVRFDQYEFSDAATMKYLSGISYRTERNGRCFAIEQLRAGSNYRDSASTQDMSQSALDRSYYLAGKIVKTVRFW
jgi:hypothetical protein